MVQPGGLRPGLGIKWNVHEAATDSRIVLSQSVENTIHQVVAYKGSCSVGNAGRKSGISHILYHSLNWKSSKISRSTVFKDRHINRLIAFVVFDAASSKLMATRSGVRSKRPPACPIQRTASGLSASIAFATLSMDLPKTVGTSSFTTWTDPTVSETSLQPLKQG